MSSEQFVEKIKVIMRGDDLWRIQVIEDADGNKQIQFDPHGMNRSTAKRQIKNIIALSPFAFTLDVIHGYNGGTVIKKMLQEDMLSKRILKKQSVVNNPGRTLISVMERYA